MMLLTLWNEAMNAVDPKSLFGGGRSGGASLRQTPRGVLCWGKAALRTWQTLQERPLRGQAVPPSLVIAPDESRARRFLEGRIVFGDHPLPGARSFKAGEALLDFFDSLRRFEIGRLEVFLSGGASSLAWLRPARLSESELRRRLEEGYARAQSIARWNRQRARLCVLKGGGAAGWLRKIAPQVHTVRVHVISDVAPFGPEVVGSGPFWDGKIPHRVVADNAALLSAIESAGARRGDRVLYRRESCPLSWDQWVGVLARKTETALKNGRSGILLMGGEPEVSLPNSPGHGGRQTQIAGALALRLWRPLLEGKVEILCMSSDGVDGRSGAAGAYLYETNTQSWLSSVSERARLRRALASFDSAGFLWEKGACLPERWTGTNVQDAAIVRVRGAANRVEQKQVMRCAPK